MDAEQAARIKKEITREARRDLTEEITAEVRDRVETDIRKEARRDFEREYRARAPSPEHRRSFRSYVREVQQDAYAQATVAARHAEQAESALDRSRSVATPASYAMTIALPFTASILASWTGGLSATFLAALATCVIAWLALVVSTVRRHGRLEAEIKAARKVSSDYQVLTERAKAYRMVHAERIDSAEELHRVLEELRLDKERLDGESHLGATEIEAAREMIRYRIEELDEDADAAAVEEADAEAEAVEERLATAPSNKP